MNMLDRPDPRCLPAPALLLCAQDCVQKTITRIQNKLVDKKVGGTRTLGAPPLSHNHLANHDYHPLTPIQPQPLPLPLPSIHGLPPGRCRLTS